MSTFPESCYAKFQALGLVGKGLQEMAYYWVIGREWKRVFQTKADVADWDKAFSDACSPIIAGKQERPTQAQENAIHALERDDMKEFTNALDSAFLEATPEKPLPGADIKNCKMDWPIFACLCSTLANAANVSQENLTNALETGKLGYWQPFCTDAVLKDPVYACATPPCGVAEKKTNWTPWIVGGVAIAALGGVAYAVTHKTSPARLASANPSGKPPRYSLAALKKMPTKDWSHFDNLKYDDGKYRVWLSRMTVADGAPYDNQVTVEQNKNGVWTQIDQYQARGAESTANPTQFPASQYPFKAVAKGMSPKWKSYTQVFREEDDATAFLEEMVLQQGAKSGELWDRQSNIRIGVLTKSGGNALWSRWHGEKGGI